ncbi:MAG: CapA family protein [Bryobacteraceae bacterium]
MGTFRFLALPAFALLPLVHSGDPAPPVPKETRLVFGGDVMMSRYVGRAARAAADPALPFRGIAPFLRDADLAFINLEAPFSDKGKPTEKGMIFRAGPEMIEGLQLSGIDIVSTANNHARDCGPYGVGFTLDWLAEHGIAAAGSGATPDAAHEGVVIARNATRFGFLAYTFDQSNGNHRDVDERVAVLDIPSMQKDVWRMRSRASVVIVSMHAGTEYSPRPNPQQRAFAHAAIDAGASIVVGHHPHVVQAPEQYAGGLILYSLGNLVFDQFQRAETQRGELAEVWMKDRKVERWKLTGVDIGRAGPRIR